jgi:hypothetical protein
MHVYTRASTYHTWVHTRKHSCLHACHAHARTHTYTHARRWPSGRTQRPWSLPSRASRLAWMHGGCSTRTSVAGPRTCTASGRRCKAVARAPWIRCVCVCVCVQLCMVCCVSLGMHVSICMWVCMGPVRVGARLGQEVSMSCARHTEKSMS